MGCHQKIDPWGIAFEEYDAVGNWQREGVGANLRKRRTSQPIDAKAECKYMKMITPENLLTSLRDGVFEIDVPPDIAVRARAAVERMIAIGPTAGRTVPAGPVFSE